MVTYLLSLVQSCCGEGGTLQTNITGVCGVCSQCMDHTGFAPTHGTCTFPVYTAQASGCSSCPKWALGFVHFPGLSCSGSGSWIFHKGTDLVGCAFRPFPGPSSSGDQVLGECTVPGGLCILINSLVSAAQFPGCATRALSQVCHVSPLGS